MGWLKKKAGKFLGKVVRTALGAASFGTSELTGVGKAAEGVTTGVTDKLTGAASDEKKKEMAALAKAEADAKAAADADYYKKIMSSRDRQVSGFISSRTDFTQDNDALGNYGENLGKFGSGTLGSYKKKKIYY